MTQRIKNYIKPTVFLGPQEIDGATNGTIIDTYLETRKFDMIFIMVAAGDFGVDVGAVKFKVQEGDESNLSDATDARGGDEITLEEGEMGKFEVERSKRYVRVTATPVASGSPSGTEGEDVALVSATGLLTNWAKYIPTL